MAEPGDPIAPRARLSLIGAFLVLWLGSTAALVVYGKHINANSERTAHTQVLAGKAQRKAEAEQVALRAAEIANCKRGNERTVAENRSQLDDYGFFTLTSRLIRVSLAHPAPNPGVSAREQAEGLARARAFVSKLDGYAADKVWHHLIENCPFAVDHPSKYHLKPAVRFSHQLPPAGALKIESGE